MLSQTEQRKLDRLLEKTTRLVVHEEEVLAFESTEPSDVAALKAAVRFQPYEYRSRCMCGGDTPITLYSATKRLGEISNQHGKAVRFTGSISDGPLVDPMLFLRWYHDRGIHGPCEDLDILEQHEKAPGDRLKWIEAIPASLRSFWPQMERAANSGGPGPHLAALREALVQDARDEATQIRTVLAWYAAGAGRWSGYPPYEQEAERLLLSFSTASLVTAVETAQDESVLDGAARLFSDWYFGPADELKAVPAKLKTRLLSRALKSPIDANRERARQAFSR